jgi:hypothetical protein
VDVTETGCRQRKVSHWSNCVEGDFGALADLASLCPVRQSFCMPGHTKRYATSLAVSLVPGCDISWSWNVWPRFSGRCVAVD